MLVELGRLEDLLDEARRCADEQADYTERAAFAAAKEREVIAAIEDPAWISEVLADYRAKAAAAGERLTDLEHMIRGEILRQETFAGISITSQLELARFLDRHGRDGTGVACRAVLLQPVAADESLKLSAYLQEKGRLREAVAAARQGWEQTGDRLLRVQWADLLAATGPADDLILLLKEDLRATPTDLALMERLARLLTEAGRLPDACEIMLRALAHPAGATRLLAEFMQWLAAAGSDELALGLARFYRRRQITNPAGVRREVAESLRRNHFLLTAVAFLDEEYEAAGGDREVTTYRAGFLVNSLRSDDRTIRQASLRLLAERRDPDVELQLATLFVEARGDELRLLVLNSLATIQGPDSLPFLERALGMDSRRVRLAAARAIGQVAAPPTPAPKGRRARLLRQPAGPPPPGADGQPAAPEGGDAAAGESAAAAGSPSQPVAPGQAVVSRRAQRAIQGQLAVEQDEDVRQALVEALHQVDPRPRRVWEGALGLRPWAEAHPRAWAAPQPGDGFRRARNYAVALVVLAVVAAMVAPIHPSPRTELVALYHQGAGMYATREAARHPTATAVITPNATATRAASAAELSSGQASDALAPDTVRVQLTGQIATVRYIGVDIPQQGTPGARTALEANRNLVIGRMVYLEQGTILRDSSGRWLRYVWLPEGQMANERLLELGFAAPAADPQDTKYQQRLADAATKAWQNHAGFWAGGNDVFPMAAVKSAEANVRGGPATDQPVKLQVKQGAVFAVLGRSEGSDWVAIRIPGFDTGWISASVVDTTVRVANLSAVK